MLEPRRPSDPKDVEELLELHDEKFLRAAYLAVLGRPADPDGLSFYVRRIRAGVSKQEILLEFASSPEAKRRAEPALDGLGELRPDDSATSPNLVSRIVRRVLASSLDPLNRQLRVIENAVFRIVEDRTVVEQATRTAEKVDLLAGRLGPAGFAMPHERQGSLADTSGHDARSHAVLEMKRFLDSP